MHSAFVITLTLVVGLILALMPMPDWTVWLRPAWILLILIYWAIYLPSQVNVGVAWLTGLLIDLLTGTLLGEHALAFTLIIYLVTRMHIRMRMYPLLQQGFIIFFFCSLYQFILYCIQGFIGQLPGSHLYWLSPIVSTLLWPWLFVLMRDCRRWFKLG